MNDQPYRVYKTKAEWNHQARVFLTIGLVLGFLLGINLTVLIWVLVTL